MGTLEIELNKLKHLNFEYDTDGSIIFKKSVSNATTNNLNPTYRVIFSDYIVKPFEGFDFHIKFNKGIAPPDTIMFGIIENETEKMYRFNLKSLDGSKMWAGWCPKKSCRLEIYNG